MRDMSTDFYEDDEPVEKVVADYESGDKGRTARLNNGRTEYLALSGPVPATPNVPNGAREVVRT